MFCRLRLKFKLRIKKDIKKHTKKYITKTHKKSNQKTNKQHKKAQEIIQPRKFKCGKTLKECLSWDSNSCEYIGSMTEVLHVSTALFFRLIKHVKYKQVKLILDFTCNNIFTQQLGTITAITLKDFKRLFMIFYATLWLKWNQKWSILFNVLSESFNTHR